MYQAISRMKDALLDMIDYIICQIRPVTREHVIAEHQKLIEQLEKLHDENKACFRDTLNCVMAPFEKKIELKMKMEMRRKRMDKMKKEIDRREKRLERWEKIQKNRD